MPAMGDLGVFSSIKDDWPAPPLHRKYVRAVYEYHPAKYQEAKTVALRAGDVVLVHLTHSNGWVDGTVLGSGTRGWLPANYCQPYDHEYIRNLFHALTRLWTRCASNEPTLSQDQRGLVAGVRYLLQRTHCLRSDDSFVRQNLTIQRTRSHLLNDLSVFVKTWESSTSNSSSAESARTPLEMGEEVTFKAFRVAIRAVKLLDVALGTQNDVLQTSESQDIQTPSDSKTRRTLVPSCLLPETDRSSSQLGPKLARASLLPSIGIMEDLPASPAYSHKHEAKSTSLNRVAERSVFDESVSPTSSRSKRRRSKGTEEQSNTFVLASDLLYSRYRSFLDHMGAFIGLHMQSMPFPERCQTTNQAFEASAALLTVLFSIRDKIRYKPKEFTSALIVLQHRCLGLSTTIPGLQRAAHESEKPRSLVNAATACLRCAGDCVSQAKHILNIHGDFMIKVENVTGPLSNPGVSFEADTVPILFGSAIDGVRTALQHRNTGSIRILKIPSSPDLSRQRHVVSPITSSVSASSSNYLKNDSLFEQSHLERASTIDSSPITETAITITYQDSVPTTGTSDDSAPSTRATTPEIHEPIPDFDQLSSALQLCEIESAVEKDVVVDIPKQADGFPSEISRILLGKDGQIVAGTLHGLVENMTSQVDIPDATMVKVFFTTYRCFSTAVDVANTLVKRYEESGDDGVLSSPARLRVLKLFKQWLETYWILDFDHAALAIIQKFVEDPDVRILPASRRKLLDLIDKARHSSSSLPLRWHTTCNDQMRPSPCSGRSEEPASVFGHSHRALLPKQWVPERTILDFDALEVARQLTLLDCRLFCLIQPADLLASISGNVTTQASRVSAISQMSTDLTNFVTFSILWTEDARKRSALVKTWALVANGCLSLQNYDTLMAIVCSLQSSTIVRLKQTWALVTPKTISLLEYLKDVVSLDRNYASLRQRMTQAKMPCLPFVGLYLTDLTFLDAGNPSHRSIRVERTENHIKAVNFDKWCRAYKILQDFERFQEPYMLRDVPEMQAWLLTCFEKTRERNSDLNAHHEQSLLIEPSVSIDEPRNGISLIGNMVSAGRQVRPILIKQASQRILSRNKYL